MRYRTRWSTRLVMWDGDRLNSTTDPKHRRNMYGCLPCPRCGENFRAMYRTGLIECDDCGHKQRGELAE